MRGPSALPQRRGQRWGAAWRQGHTYPSRERASNGAAALRSSCHQASPSPGGPHPPPDIRASRDGPRDCRSVPPLSPFRPQANV